MCINANLLAWYRQFRLVGWNAQNAYFLARRVAFLAVEMTPQAMRAKLQQADWEYFLRSAKPGR